MKLSWALAVLGCWPVAHHLVAGSSAEPAGEPKVENDWEYSVSAATYVVQNGTDYVNPVITADHDWLHVEARYNYEALKTGSFWFGYNFSFGDKLVLDATPMLGGVFGNVAGAAPGYTLSLNYKCLELFTQGEYFIDSSARSDNFFYTWSELSVAPVEWLRLGLVIDRTKTIGTSIDIRRGPLLGFTYKAVDFTAYWLDPASGNSAFILSVGVNF